MAPTSDSPDDGPPLHATGATTAAVGDPNATEAIPVFRPPQPGEVIGRYQIEAVIGRGGFATVYRVRHLALDAPFALKVLTQLRPQQRARLMEEGRIQARLHHPNLVPVTDVLDVGGAPGLVMEFVDGPSLKSWLYRSRPEPALSEQLFRGIVAGVAAAHAGGVIHRDLKPGNVLLQLNGDDWIPRVMDFGLARLAEGSGHTRSGAMMGTPAYMAPEQIGGASRVDLRADLFSLGCVLYELLTGKPPFRGPALGAIFSAILDGRYAELDATSAPPHLARAIEACLAVDPDARPPTCAALLEILDGGDLPARRRKETPHNLPRAVDDFVGRGRELEALGEALDGGDLVTVTGPGGCGKTRLTMQFARDHLADWPGGVWFCGVEEATTARGVAEAVALALDTPMGDRDPIAQLGAAIDGRGRCLLILDNFEQVAYAGPETVDRWRQLAPEAAFLISSREALRLRGERLLPLTPLPLPDADADARAIGESEAVQLFALRARALRPDFALGPENAADVAALTRTLDGLPLAIELAAARIRLYTPAAMRQRLDQRFRLLRARRRGGPDRHATLRGAIDWSWELLAPWERAAMAQSGIFEAGFTLEAAEAVIDLSEWPDAPWLDEVLESLIAKSLLMSRTAAEQTGGRAQSVAPRFGMLTSIRAYAREALPPERAEPVARRHDAFYAESGQAEALDTLETHGGGERLWALTLGLEDLRAASRRALGRRDAETAARACLAAMEVMLLRGPFLEIAELAGQVIAAGPPRPERLRLLLQQGRVLRLAGRMAPAEDALRAALAQASEPPGAPRLEALALNNLGLLLHDRGRMDESAGCFETALDRLGAADTPQPRLEGIALGNLGRLLHDRGRLDDAERCYRQALALHRQVGNRNFEGIALSDLGRLELQRGRRGDDRLHLESALRLHRALGNRRSEGITLGVLGQLHHDRGRLREAERSYREALALHRQVGNRRSEGAALCDLGRLAMEAGRQPEAAAHLEAAASVACEVDDPGLESAVAGLTGLLAARAGDPESAQAHLARGESLLRDAGQPHALAWLLCWSVEAALRGDDLERARARAADCQAQIEALGLAPTSGLARWLSGLSGTLAKG